MQRKTIKDKLQELDIELGTNTPVGLFDRIAEFTIKSVHDQGSEEFLKVGAFSKKNLEHGLLLYAIIKKYELTSCLELGFGTGYSALCAATAFEELDNGGLVYVVEPKLDPRHVQFLEHVFGNEIMRKICIAQGEYEDVVSKIQDKYDIVHVNNLPKRESKIEESFVKDVWRCFCLRTDTQAIISNGSFTDADEELSGELPEFRSCTNSMPSDAHHVLSSDFSFVESFVKNANVSKEPKWDW